MTKDLEDQLRQAYAGLPQPRARRSQARSAVRVRARRLQRRRAMLTVAGAGTAAAAVVATALVGAGLEGRQTSVPLTPATPPATHVTSPESDPPPPSGRIPGEVDMYADQKNRRLHGVSGRLLPHGSQLPQGLSYRPSGDRSTVNGHARGSFLSNGIWSQAKDAEPASSRPRSHQAIAVADDTALNHGPDGQAPGDGDPAQRSLTAVVARFPTAEGALGAWDDVRRGVGPWRWGPRTRWSELPWSGADDGLSRLLAMRHGTYRDYQAIQFVGPFIVSASSVHAGTAKAAVGHMVANLRAAKLVK